MKTINKVLAYSISSLWLALIVILVVDYKLLLTMIFWTISLTLCLPTGIIIEAFYSMIYLFIRKIFNKINLNFVHLIICIKDKDYAQNYQEIEKFSYSYLNDPFYQQFLSENNIIRNMWLSSIFGFFFCLGYYFSGFVNSIEITKILFWLPSVLPLMWIANIRMEILIKKRKFLIFKENRKNSNNEHTNIIKWN